MSQYRKEVSHTPSGLSSAMSMTQSTALKT